MSLWGRYGRCSAGVETASTDDEGEKDGEEEVEEKEDFKDKTKSASRLLNENSPHSLDNNVSTDCSKQRDGICEISANGGSGSGGGSSGGGGGFQEIMRNITGLLSDTLWGYFKSPAKPVTVEFTTSTTSTDATYSTPGTSELVTSMTSSTSSVLTESQSEAVAGYGEDRAAGIHDIEEVLTSTLGALYARATPAVVNQAWEVLSKDFHGDLQHFQAGFLNPVLALLLKLQECQGSDNPNQPWPLAISDSVIVHLSRRNTEHLLNVGDFCLCAVTDASDEQTPTTATAAATTTSTAEVVVCCLGSNGVHEFPVEEVDFDSVLTMEWAKKVREAQDHEMVYLLRQCLVASEYTVRHLRWEDISHQNPRFWGSRHKDSRRRAEDASRDGLKHSASMMNTSQIGLDDTEETKFMSLPTAHSCNDINSAASMALIGRSRGSDSPSSVYLPDSTLDESQTEDDSDSAFLSPMLSPPAPSSSCSLNQESPSPSHHACPNSNPNPNPNPDTSQPYSCRHSPPNSPTDAPPSPSVAMEDPFDVTVSNQRPTDDSVSFQTPLSSTPMESREQMPSNSNPASQESPPRSHNADSKGTTDSRSTIGDRKSPKCLEMAPSLASPCCQAPISGDDNYCANQHCRGRAIRRSWESSSEEDGRLLSRSFPCHGLRHHCRHLSISSSRSQDLPSSPSRTRRSLSGSPSPPHPGRPMERSNSSSYLVRRLLECPAGICDVNQELVTSGVAILPGCHDDDGRQLVFIFTCSSLWEERRLLSVDLAQLLMYYHSLPRKHQTRKGMAVVVDIRGTTTSTINVLLEALYLFKDNVPNAISIVHLFADKTTQSYVVKSPLYDSKASLNLKILMSAEHLQEYIHLDQLPMVLDGLFPYNHESWVRFRQKLESFMSKCRKVACHLVDLMEEISAQDHLPQSIAEASELIESHDQRVKSAFSNENLVSLQNDGPLLISSLEREHESFSHSEDYRFAMEQAMSLHQHLQDCISRLVRLADMRMTKLHNCQQLREYEDECTKVIDWLAQEGNVLLEKYHKTSDNLKSIRNQQKDFEKFYFSAMSYVEKGNDLIEEASMLSQCGHFSEATGYKDLARTLKHQLQDFTGQLEESRERIEATARCYHMLDKSYEWALEAMKYMASMKMEHSSTAKGLDKLLRSLNVYLSDHPPISDSHFASMVDAAHGLGNDKLAQQCSVAKSRCQETHHLLQLRLSNLRRARNQLEVEHALSQDKMEGDPAPIAPSSVFDVHDMARPIHNMCQDMSRDYRDLNHGTGDSMATPGSRRFSDDSSALSESKSRHVTGREEEDDNLASLSSWQPKETSTPAMAGAEIWSKRLPDNHSPTRSKFMSGRDKEEDSIPSFQSQSPLDNSSNSSLFKTPTSHLSFAESTSSSSSPKHLASPSTPSSFLPSSSMSPSVFSLSSSCQSSSIQSSNLTSASHPTTPSQFSLPLSSSSTSASTPSTPSPGTASLPTATTKAGVNGPTSPRQYHAFSMSRLYNSSPTRSSSPVASAVRQSQKGRNITPLSARCVHSLPSGQSLTSRPHKKVLKRAITAPVPMLTSPILEEEAPGSIQPAAIPHTAAFTSRDQRNAKSASLITGSSESLPSMPEEEVEDDLDLAGGEDYNPELKDWTPVPVNTHLHSSSISATKGTPTGPMADLRLSEAEMKTRRTISLVMSEMIQTERDYVRALQFITEYYIPELQRDDVPQMLRGKRTVIFGNLERIYHFHSQYFLKQLESCQNQPFLVGQIFLQHETMFYLYALYNKNKPKSDVLMMEYGKEFFRQKQIELGDKMDLSSYLLKPVQRMGKYALLLKQLLKECTETDPEYPELKAAEEMVKFQLRHGNDLLAMDSLRDCDVNLQEQGRLLRQEEFLVFQGRKKSMRRIFLFEDLILFSKTRRGRQGQHDIYVYKNSIKTADIGMTENFGDSDCKFEIWFRRWSVGENYILQAPSADVKKVWVKDISRLLWRQAIRNRESRINELATMGIGNKPCMDIKPSEDNIQDRSINVSLNNRGSRTRSSIAVSSFDYLRNGNKRPHSIVSISSTSSSGSSQSSFGLLGSLNLAFDPLDSPRLNRRSYASNESGIVADSEMPSGADCQNENQGPASSKLAPSSSSSQAPAPTAVSAVKSYFDVMKTRVLKQKSSEQVFTNV